MKKNINLNNILILFVLFTLLFSCQKIEKKTNNIAIDEAKGYKGLSVNIALDKASQGQTIEVQLQEMQERKTALNIDKIIFDKNINWQAMDKKFEELNIQSIGNYEKQYFIAHIIMKKELLSDMSKEALEATNKYVNILIDTKYEAFGILYFALKNLNTNPNYKESIAEQVNKIKQYANQDKLKAMKELELTGKEKNDKSMKQMITHGLYFDKLNEFVKQH